MSIVVAHVGTHEATEARVAEAPSAEVRAPSPSPRSPAVAAPQPDYADLFARREDPFEVAAPMRAVETLSATPTPRGSVFIGSGVRIYGNVTIHGDVYISTSK